MPQAFQEARLIRPQDLVVLNVSWSGLVAAQGRLEVEPGEANGFLIVDFPPQHILEEVFYQASMIPEEDLQARGRIVPGGRLQPKKGRPKFSDEPQPPPIRSYIAWRSRLVFAVPAGAAIPLASPGQPGTFAVEGSAFLEALSNLRMVIPENAVAPKVLYVQYTDMFPSGIYNLATSDQPSIARARARNVVRAVSQIYGMESPGDWQRVNPHVEETDKFKPKLPDDLQTAIELPFRLILSPNEHGAWFHRATPYKGDTDFTELWHTRLGVWLRSSLDKKEPRIDGSHLLRNVRAVWTRDRQLDTPRPNEPVDAGTHNHEPIPASLDAFDRRNIVHLSSNFALKTDKNGAEVNYLPKPIEVHGMMLSALGGWLDGRGVWDFPMPKGLEVEEWRHRTTMGRDHYVRVVYAGFLFPFGHRASLVKVTERKVQGASGPAYLRQSMFIVVKEPVHAYRNTGFDKDGRFIDRWLPFSHIRITTLLSPPLDKPSSSEIYGQGQQGFWPSVGGKPFHFHCIAVDVEGQQVEFTMPLVFVAKAITDLDLKDNSPIPGIGDKYNDEKNLPKRTAFIGGQRIAYADSLKANGEQPIGARVIFPTHKLTFSAFVPEADLYDNESKLSWYNARFFPLMEATDVTIPALEHLVGKNARLSASYWPGFLKYGWKVKDESGNVTNPGEIFLQANSPQQTRFSEQSDRSGALSAPDLNIVGLSRRIGPISGKEITSGLTRAAKDSFEPADFFGALDGAMLLGSFKLSDIVKEGGTLKEAPRFVGGKLSLADRILEAVQVLRQDLLDNQAASLMDDVSKALEEMSKDVGDLVQSLKDEKKTGLAPTTLMRIDELIDALGQWSLQVDSFNQGGQSSVADIGRLEWTAHLKSNSLFEPKEPLRVMVEAIAEEPPDGDAEGNSKPKAAAPGLITTAVLCNFTLRLAGSALTLPFKKLLFQIEAGKKPQIDVVLGNIIFGGALQFVKVLEKYIPTDGFSDPPAVEATASGITAGYTLPLPPLAVGAFSLQHVILGAGFNIPFIGDPLYAWFNFAERDNPAILTVGPFGGGAFFGVSVYAQGIRTLEASLEFGAGVAVNFGVAAGSVTAMGGVYFELKDGQINLRGFFRLRGAIKALGIVSVSIELYISLEPYEKLAEAKAMKGYALIWVEVDLGLVEKDIKIEASKKFAGSTNSDPTFAEMMSQTDWESYWAAFADY